MSACGAVSTWDTGCVLPDTPEHLDHLDEGNRSWLNEAMIVAHDRREQGKPLARAAKLAAQIRPVTTARYAPLRHPNAVRDS